MASTINLLTNFPLLGCILLIEARNPHSQLTELSRNKGTNNPHIQQLVREKRLQQQQHDDDSSTEDEEEEEEETPPRTATTLQVDSETLKRKRLEHQLAQKNKKSKNFIDKLFESQQTLQEQYQEQLTKLNTVTPNPARKTTKGGKSAQKGAKKMNTNQVIKQKDEEIQRLQQEIQVHQQHYALQKKVSLASLGCVFDQ